MFNSAFVLINHSRWIVCCIKCLKFMRLFLRSFHLIVPKREMFHTNTAGLDLT